MRFPLNAARPICSCAVGSAPLFRPVTMYLPVVLAGGIPLLLWFFSFDRPDFPVAPDTASYAIPGAAFWRGQGYGALDGSGNFIAEMVRTPLYPLLIGPWYSDSSRWYAPVLVFQALLRAAMALLWLRLPGARTSSAIARVGIFAAWFVALDALGALLAVRVLTETLSAFLLVATVWTLLRWRISGRWAWLVAAGAAAGANVVCRPINLAAAGALALVIMVVLFRDLDRRQWRRGLGCFMAFTLTVAFLPGVWIGRNAAWAGRPILSLTAAENLHAYRAAYIISVLEGRRFYDVQDEFRAREHAQAARTQAPPWERARANAAEARAIILAHPLIHLRGMVLGLARGLLGPGVETWRNWAGPILEPGSGADTAQPPAAAAAGTDRAVNPAQRWLGLFMLWTIAHLALLYLLTLKVLWISLRRRAMDFPVGVCLVLFVSLMAVAVGPETYSRFRVPLMPLLALVAAWSFSDFSSLGRSRAFSFPPTAGNENVGAEG